MMYIKVFTFFIQNTTRSAGATRHLLVREYISQKTTPFASTHIQLLCKAFQLLERM